MSKQRVRLPVEVRREQVITEAMALLTEVGYHRFTLAELARRCDMTRQGLLHYLPSKEHALLAVLEERDKRDQASLVMEQEVSGRPGQVRELFDPIVALDLAQPELARLHVILTAEALADDHPAHDYFLRRLASIKAGLGPVLESPGRRGEDAVVAVFAYIDGLLLAWLREPEIDLMARWCSFADVSRPLHSVRTFCESSVSI